MRLLILSASARFIASSCDRAGCEFHAIDLFGDWDLRRLCDDSRRNTNKCSTIKSLHEILLPLDERFDGVVFGGGLENQPDLIRKLNRHMPILGTSGDQLARMIDIENFKVTSDLILSAGGNAPAIKTRIDENDDPAMWLRKNRAGAGGQHIRTASIEDFDKPAADSYFFQRFIDGESISAVFVSVPQHSCQLLGLTKQWVGESNLGASRFSYCGSIGPLDIATYDLEVIERIGRAFSSEYQIAGVFGIDLIINPMGVWPVDINPRIPSSAEIFELFQASNSKDQNQQELFSIAGIHLAACQGETLKSAMQHAFEQQPSPCFFGKAILFWQRAESIEVDSTCQRLLLDEFWHAKNQPMPDRWVADIPCSGKTIHRGDPVLSLFASGKTTEQVEKRLLRYAGQLEFALINHRGTGCSGGSKIPFRPA